MIVGFLQTGIKLQNINKSFGKNIFFIIAKQTVFAIIRVFFLCHES